MSSLWLSAVGTWRNQKQYVKNSDSWFIFQYNLK